MRTTRKCDSHCRRSARERPGCGRSTRSLRASMRSRTPERSNTRCRDARSPPSSCDRRHGAARPTHPVSRSVRRSRLEMKRPERTTDVTDADADVRLAGRQRVVIERLRPEIDAGRFPVKRAIGEEVSITVDMFADGHDLLAGVLKHRHVSRDRRGGPSLAAVARAKAAGPPGSSAPSAPWTEVPLDSLGNDSWGASFTVTELGEYEYIV